jgi:hypothetical protein
VTAKQAFLQTLNVLAQTIRAGSFTPLYEADVQSYLYHLLLQAYVPLPQLWAETRVSQINTPDERYHFDLVMGDLDRTGASVVPQLVLQLKYFSWAFSEQQCRRRMESALSTDVPTLGLVWQRWHVPCYEVLLDLKPTASTLRGFLDHQWYERPCWQVIRHAAQEQGVGAVWITPRHKNEVGLKWLAEPTEMEPHDSEGLAEVRPGGQ